MGWRKIYQRYYKLPTFISSPMSPRDNLHHRRIALPPLVLSRGNRKKTWPYIYYNMGKVYKYPRSNVSNCMMQHYCKLLHILPRRVSIPTPEYHTRRRKSNMLSRRPRRRRPVLPKQVIPIIRIKRTTIQKRRERKVSKNQVPVHPRHSIKMKRIINISSYNHTNQ